jgi:hypothetical protein
MTHRSRHAFHPRGLTRAVFSNANTLYTSSLSGEKGTTIKAQYTK